MRRGIAHFLRTVADFLWVDDSDEIFELRDDYGIPRCRLEVHGDQHGHGISSLTEELPAGWYCSTKEKGSSQ